MYFDVSRWKRLVYEQIPVYVRGDMPCWFVPNSAGDRLLQQVKEGKLDQDHPAAQRFLQRLPNSRPLVYNGRVEHLTMTRLSELWLHITNHCDLSCRHCLFASGPGVRTELSFDEIAQRVDEAVALGCKVFALTGGEPLVHPDFIAIVRHIHQYPDTHVAVLTNGMSLQSVLDGVALDWHRFHLQISVDGLEQRHDHLRGAGNFHRLQRQMAWLRTRGHRFTVSMCVEKDNLNDMAAVVDMAADCGAGNIHFMWYFIRGRGHADKYVTPKLIFTRLLQAWRRATERGLSIDNFESLKAQVFAPVGTIHDGSGCGWESAAIGPDGQLYPSAALVGMDELATPIVDSLATSWRSSTVLDDIRNSSCQGDDSVWRFILGGGDSDHSYMSANTFVGDDPYLPLYEQMALQLITDMASRLDEGEAPALRMKMGDYLESCGAHGKVALLHSNCLLSLTHEDSRSVVKSFYAEAVGDSKEEILNPVCYDAEVLSHIPPEYRLRGYGCGSPVLDADIQPGETILDMGCGSGVECFIAARLTGSSGQVIGVDMLLPMLKLARSGAEQVALNLGYDNLDFRHAYLEQLPVADNSVDLILSNCVLNLSSDKRQLFAEMLRVLKPGGRLVVADVVCETDPDAALRNDEVLRGECIAGALTQKDLNGLLDETGFNAFGSLKRVPYRQVQGHPFFSLTFRAYKANASAQVRVMYPGPFPSLTLDDGRVVTPGQVFELSRVEAEAAGSALYQLDNQGQVVNVEFSNSCNCALPQPQQDGENKVTARKTHGCMTCGAPLIYQDYESERQCHYCGKIFSASVWCEQGHYVCDQCHCDEALPAITSMCHNSEETDMLKLFQQVRRHPAVPLHGPQYHALVPAIILTCYRNSGGSLAQSALEIGMKRGAKIMGGSCAFNGVCGAATGVGIAFSLILEANPLKADQRQVVQSVVQQVLQELASFNAARCCNRDCVVALCRAAQLSQKFLPQELIAESWQPCEQQHLNSDCLGATCPLAAANSVLGRKERKIVSLR